MERSEGERVRLVHIIERARATIDTIETDLATSNGVPIGLDSAHAFSSVARELTTALIRLDAYQRAEDDAATEREARDATRETNE